MYGSELTEELRGDSGNAVGVRALCARLFSLGISSAEARLVSRQLQDALNRGAVGDLVGTALRLFRAAERGEWFDFATLRMRARGDPRWSAALQDYDVVIIDEAQDLNVVMAELVMEVAPQKMLVFVGDGGQKLYAFMACRDVTEILPPESFNAWILYMSFRYGKKVCDLINTLQLPLVPTFAAEGAPDTLVQAVGSGLEVAEPHVSLFATWADAIAAANKYLERGRSVSMDSVKRHELLEAACSEDDDAGYQQVLKRVSRAGALRILSAIRDAGEDAMDVFISTVHGYKVGNGDRHRRRESSHHRRERHVSKVREAEGLRGAHEELHHAISRSALDAWLLGVGARAVEVTPPRGLAGFHVRILDDLLVAHDEFGKAVLADGAGCHGRERHDCLGGAFEPFVCCIASVRDETVQIASTILSIAGALLVAAAPHVQNISYLQMNPATFPHDPRSASKTAKSGVVTVNDVICEDTFSVMTRSSAADPASSTRATYALDADTATLVEGTRSVQSVEEGVAASALLLLRTDPMTGTQTMEPVLTMAPDATQIRAVDSTGTASTATFDQGGLKWDKDNCAIYLGSDVFRIIFSPGDEESGGVPCLRVQGRTASGVNYVTRFSVTNDNS
ncbi:hypothetical protein JKP88DRAFT_241209 [Tribonema minus]|uniref:UvrD-like helicase ATP-binding domain-containing protein n=1 Tax=Tribonema minus TaxID=303371 RepID=A0A836CDY6_9STRA|nr:hypothetical protein JKP88DRAFT_241209 [Tribonema minus]